MAQSITIEHKSMTSGIPFKISSTETNNGDSTSNTTLKNTAADSMQTSGETKKTEASKRIATPRESAAGREK